MGGVSVDGVMPCRQQQRQQQQEQHLMGGMAQAKYM